ncbi:MAG TPA: hypothetical protein VKH35_06225, partial [Thermoanaerobaculia bacterium]|nr:hypothetical protein [Thermoanaerobaculia bacterium]
MRVRLSSACVALGLLLASTASARPMAATDRLSETLSLGIGGSFWIDNPIGSIEIVGTDSPGLNVTAVRTVTGEDQAAVNEGREQTVINFQGDQNVRFIQTVVAQTHARNWNSTVAYTIRVPRTVHVRVASRFADRIRIANIAGNVTVKSLTGLITLDGVSGASIIDITNGKVVFHYTQKPSSHAQIQAVNADIDVSVPPDSNLNWIADTLRGDVLTNLPVRAEFQGSLFHGTVNAPGGPNITTQTAVGNVRLLGNGLPITNLKSLRQVAESQNVVAQQKMLVARSLMLRPARRVQLPIVSGGFDFATSVGDVSVGEIRGPARIQTAAGEIELGMVYGDCNVGSLGGPLDLGDIMGTLTASTGAGDVQVRSAALGGHISTAGGMIRVLYTAGPTTLESGGGDIVVRQAAGPINATTQSGDITITADPNQNTQK